MKYTSIFLLFIAGFLLLACNEEKIEYGDGLIYMPQATRTGGVNAFYRIPSGGGEMTYNFKSEGGKIKVILGVTRSGTFEGEDFTVDIVTLQDKTDELIASGQVRNAAPMPVNLFSLPEKVTITGSNGATFFLEVDSAALMNDLSYTGKNFVLTVGLANPSKYALAETNTYTSVIVNVDAIKEHYFRYIDGIVYRKGNKLYLNGKEYKSGSFNAPALSGCSGDGRHLFSDSDIDALFASLPDNIMVRTWAFPGSKAHTDKLIKAAEKHKIKLILVLGNGLSYCGHVDGSVGGEWSPKTPEWFASGYKNEFLPYVIDMATTYKDSPAVGMWEILHRAVGVDWQLIKTFMNDVAKEIKTADPNHLVATGTWAKWAYGESQDNLQSIHDSHYIDVGTLQEGDTDVDESWHYPALRNAMNNLEKVSMVSEIEINGGDGCDYTKEGRRDRIKAKYDYYLANDASVVTFSELVKAGAWCNSFTQDDPVMEMIKNYPINVTCSKY